VTVLFVALGAAVGAPLRYLVDRAVQARHDSVFPWGTVSVNVVGSGVLGLVVGLRTAGMGLALVGTGFCGALTTYSTFSYETMRLAEEGSRFYATLNVGASVAAGLGAAWFGLLVADAING
jgi:fluoride exporter